tara:strand:- start:150 stop:329 length:180 start_codon:yes stop_codon:yes gene_type:complete
MRTVDSRLSKISNGNNRKINKILQKIKIFHKSSSNSTKTQNCQVENCFSLGKENRNQKE